MGEAEPAAHLRLRGAGSADENAVDRTRDPSALSPFGPITAPTLRRRRAAGSEGPHQRLFLPRGKRKRLALASDIAFPLAGASSLVLRRSDRSMN